jgi:hypothetical protein
MNLIWSLRGVPDAIPAWAASAAKLQRLTVGQWVTRVVLEALEQQARLSRIADDALPPKGSKSRPSAVEAPDGGARLEAIEQRVAGLESRDASSTVKTRKSPEKTGNVTPDPLGGSRSAAFGTSEGVRWGLVTPSRSVTHPHRGGSDVDWNDSHRPSGSRVDRRAAAVAA